MRKVWFFHYLPYRRKGVSSLSSRDCSWKGGKIYIQALEFHPRSRYTGHTHTHTHNVTTDYRMPTFAHVHRGVTRRIMEGWAKVETYQCHTSITILAFSKGHMKQQYANASMYPSQLQSWEKSLSLQSASSPDSYWSPRLCTSSPHSQTRCAINKLEMDIGSSWNQSIQV